MAGSGYIVGRKRYGRPQAMLWSNNPGSVQEGYYVPSGYEYGTAITSPNPLEDDQFLILSDHNRSEISFSSQRIEQRQRMINGRMRSHHISDKLIISTSWSMLPSRRYSEDPQFDINTGKSTMFNTPDEYTVDGGAGGIDLLEWYENHQGSFYVFLAYDKYTNFTGSTAYNKLGIYNQVLEVYFSDFNYTVVKRGSTNHDLWNISVTLEEA